VQVLVTPPDRQGQTWRIEVDDAGRVRVYRAAGRTVWGVPLRAVRDVHDLGRWLVERGIDPDQLLRG